jgi:hypothetical protein
VTSPVELQLDWREIRRLQAAIRACEEGVPFTEPPPEDATRTVSPEELEYYTRFASPSAWRNAPEDQP